MAWKTIVMRPGIFTTPGNSQMETLNWAQPSLENSLTVGLHVVRNSLWDDQNPPRGALFKVNPGGFNTSISPTVT
jgi:hypothetical protein